ncbi:TPA: hypothetical protein MN540_005082 [Klebsiella pneumoniae]|nr:hypothetical protein [Klebsiella pneumoniae]
MSIESSPFEQATTPTDLMWPILAVFLFMCIGFGFYAFMKKDFSIISNLLGVFVRVMLFSACIGVLLFLWLSSNQEKEKWQNFAAEHCKVIEKRDGQNTTGVGMSLTGKIGAFFGRSSAQTSYQCDDGVTYWKNE